MRKIILPPYLLATCLIGMIALDRLVSPHTFLHGDITYTGYLLALIGIALPIWGAQIFKKRKTNILPYRNPDQIVTEGPFKFSRNPMYLGMLLILLGATVKLGILEGLLFVGLFFTIANWWYIPFEEERMKETFGESFEDYRTRVRRWL